MKLVEFKLKMPGRASWNGAWSGEGKNYSLVRELSDEDFARLFDLVPSGSPTVVACSAVPGLSATRIAAKCLRVWSHRWSDGWVAEVTARVVPADEELAKSDGFCGYEWMVDNILSRGTPYGEVTS
jgi:hypothetical protein